MLQRHVSRGIAIQRGPCIAARRKPRGAASATDATACPVEPGRSGTIRANSASTTPVGTTSDRSIGLGVRPHLDRAPYVGVRRISGRIAPLADSAGGPTRRPSECRPRRARTPGRVSDGGENLTTEVDIARMFYTDGMETTNPRRSIFMRLVEDGMSGERAAKYLDEWDQEAERRRIRPGPEYWRLGVAWINEQRPDKRQRSQFDDSGMRSAPPP